MSIGCLQHSLRPNDCRRSIFPRRQFFRRGFVGFDLANFGQQTELGLPPVKTIEQGAATSVLLAASPDVEGVTGRYYEDCAEATPITERAGHIGGVARYALDVGNAERLWQVSADLTQ
jgi:hypothetical protein